jgi:hypothetical protein
MRSRAAARSSRSRPAVLCIFAFLALLVLAGCSEEKPTGPEIDPLVGLWVGSFTRLEGLDSGYRTFRLTVQTGGRAVGTGYCLYEDEGDYYAEHLYLELEVAADGAMAGQGVWLWEMMGVGIIYTEGVVSGALDAVAGTGTGSLDIDTGEGIFAFDWQVIKEDLP